ncbi:hypothetical protein [Streptomyces halstedii]|uniref:hypothetical protein n=1 Tax=Streptomyces halstedii TaxID=1944 RepID=UPI00382E773D
MSFPGLRERHTNRLAGPQDMVGDEHLRLGVGVLELDPDHLCRGVRICTGTYRVEVLHHPEPIPSGAGVQCDIHVASAFQVGLGVVDVPPGLLGALLELELLAARA